MKIKDIRHVETNETRADKHNPTRIGSTVEFMYEPIVGDVLWLSYISDNQGNEKHGFFHTSRIADIAETDTEITVTTNNSIYCFEK